MEELWWKLERVRRWLAAAGKEAARKLSMAGMRPR